MRYKFYKTHSVDEFYAVRMTRKGSPKLVQGKPNFAHGIVPVRVMDCPAVYAPGEIDLSRLSYEAHRCLKEEALTGMGEFGKLVTERGLQFRYSVSSGVYAIVKLSGGKPIPAGEYNEKIPVIRGTGLRHSFVCAETLHLDKVVSANVARKYDPEFVDAALKAYAAFTA